MNRKIANEAPVFAQIKQICPITDFVRAGKSTFIVTCKENKSSGDRLVFDSFIFFNIKRPLWADQRGLA